MEVQKREIHRHKVRNGFLGLEGDGKIGENSTGSGFLFERIKMVENCGGCTYL